MITYFPGRVTGWTRVGERFTAGEEKETDSRSQGCDL